MNKSHKTLFIFLIILLFNYNLSESFLTFYSHTFCNDTLKVAVIRAIPLLILLICYFTNISSSKKLSINYICLSIGILAFIIIQIHKLAYFYLLIDNINNTFLFIMNVIFIFFIFLTFFRNLKKGEYIILYIFLVVPIFITLQFVFEIKIVGITPICTYTNPARYEFVKSHYFSTDNFSYLPDKIPDDATNITFYYDFYSTEDRKLYLEYNSYTIQNENHYIKYEASSKNTE